MVRSHLRSMGPGVQPDAPVRLFVMGTNVWRDESEWPLARVGGVLVSAKRRPRELVFEATASLSADLADRARTAGHFRVGSAEPGADPRRRHDRKRSRGGAAGRRGAAPRRARLHYGAARGGRRGDGATDGDAFRRDVCAPTDFTAKLVDVQRDGTPYNVSDGALRRRYTASTDPATADPVPIEISLWPTSMVFRQGHRIRLEVASSNFPLVRTATRTPARRSRRRPTTARGQAGGARGPRALSRIVLPVVPSAPTR